MKEERIYLDRNEGGTSDFCEQYPVRDVLVILPLYRNAALITDLFCC